MIAGLNGHAGNVDAPGPTKMVVALKFDPQMVGEGAFPRRVGIGLPRGVSNTKKKSNKRRMARPGESQRLPSGLRELPSSRFGGSLMSKANAATEGQSPTPLAAPTPRTIGSGPFVHTPDQRSPGDSPLYRFTNPQTGDLASTASEAARENRSIRWALHGIGAPISHRIYGQEALTRHIEAAANLLRLHQLYAEHPQEFQALQRSTGIKPLTTREKLAAQEWMGIASNPRRGDIYSDLDDAAWNLMHAVRERHPWLKTYDKLAAAHDENMRPRFKEIGGSGARSGVGAGVGSNVDNFDDLELVHPEHFEPPTIPLAQNLPPLKVANAPGELARGSGGSGGGTGGSASRLGYLAQMHKAGSSPEQMIEGLMRKFLLTLKQARGAVGRFVKKQAAVNAAAGAAQKMSRRVQEWRRQKLEGKRREEEILGSWQARLAGAGLMPSRN